MHAHPRYILHRNNLSPCQTREMHCAIITVFVLAHKNIKFTNFCSLSKIRCTIPFSECLTDDHEPECFCKEGFHGNGTESCVPQGFNVEANKVKKNMFLTFLMIFCSVATSS